MLSCEQVLVPSSLFILGRMVPYNLIDLCGLLTYEFGGYSGYRYLYIVLIDWKVKSDLVESVDFYLVVQKYTDIAVFREKEVLHAPHL